MSDLVVPAYKNARLPIAERAKDLLSRMTTEEKIGQLLQLDGRGDFDNLIDRIGVGSLLHINGAQANEALHRSLKTRLGIPVLLADDGIHGHSFWAGASIFPTQLSLAASWNKELLKAVARATAKEMRATGLKWTFSPVLCLTRDLRWGRVGETFGEDPWLIGEFASAMIQGYQGKGLEDPDAVLATAKHYAGYSETLGGRDASEADISHRKLRSYFLPPFKKAVKEGCRVFMTGYQSMDGIPSTANSWLLKEVLRDEWGFEGTVITDWDTVGSLVVHQQICADLAEASALALKSGNDFIMATPGFFEACKEALERNLLSLEELDAVVLRVLDLKFRLGLFEDAGYSSDAAIKHHIACEEHTRLNLQAARESLVMLKNDGILPFVFKQDTVSSKNKPRLVVLGPNADDPIAQLGDWSLGSGQAEGSNGPAHPRDSIITILDGLKLVYGEDADIDYLPACSIFSDSEDLIPLALETCEKADLVVMVLGDHIDFIGELCSTATLELQGSQKALAKKVLPFCKKQAIPAVCAIIASKPLVLPREVLEAPALFYCFNPGMQGGLAFAEALKGRINPEGHLTVSIPYHVGQQPVYYNQTRGQHGSRYADFTQDPAFAFGEGLTYTHFSVSKAHISSQPKSVTDTDTPLVFAARIKNTGAYDGSAVLQVYLEDCVCSATWAQKELKGFAKIPLKAGEERDVQITIPLEELSIVNAKEERLVEPGEFKLWYGWSSRPKDLENLSFILSKE